MSLWKQDGMKGIQVRELTLKIIKNRQLGFFSKYIIACLLIGILWKPCEGQNFQKCNLKNSTTYSGEKITYKVFYTLAGVYVAAGEAVFTNQLEKYNQKQVFHVKGEGHTYKSYDWFFKVRDLYESYIDTLSMLPLQFVRNVSEGNNRIHNKTLFNHKDNVALSGKIKTKTPDCVQDVLSAIYYARNINYDQYKVNDTIPFDMFLDDNVYHLYLRYLGKETIKTRYGSFSCFKIKPKLIEGTIFRGGEEMIVYVSDDAKKIPVYIETPIIVGKVKVYFFPDGKK